MDTLLSVFPSDSTPLMVLGDFNLPSDKLHSSGLLALLNSFSLSFNSCPSTQKGGNVLDLVFTHPSAATDMTATPLCISDHHLVSFTITLPVLPKRNFQHLFLTRRNLHSISTSSIASCTLSSLPDHDSFSSLPLDSATDTFLSSFSSTMDILCPLSTIRRKNSSPAPWLSDVLRNNRRELRSAERKWKKSKLDTDLISYRMLLSKFSLDVTSAKTSFYKEKLETSAQDPRKLYNIFLSLLNPPAPALHYSFIDAALNCTEIIWSCNPTTCPLEPIPSAILQTILPDLLPFITTVINGSLTSGHVPTIFKKARVIPILKKPALDPSDISNYRPVSLLSFPSKILKHVVCNQLSDYLMQNNLHDPNQSGFKAAHSKKTALLAVTEKLHAARSAKLSSVLILLDLSAAFDTVNHKTLLSTLRSLGICGTAWEWFASYLHGRSYQPGHGGSSLSRDAQTSLSPDTSSSSSGEIPRRSQVSQETKSWVFPGVSSQWGMPGTPPQGDVPEASEIDAQATSTVPFRCGGAAAPNPPKGFMIHPAITHKQDPKILKLLHLRKELTSKLEGASHLFPVENHGLRFGGADPHPSPSHSAAKCPSACCKSWLEGANRTTSSAKSSDEILWSPNQTPSSPGLRIEILP
ncbi:hypothetical protein QTP70_003066 [Hemibagrus guttatus]|uniref:Reverse transcriptase domain-containing protein n=1 Tax=Hemibagrus guttatus TaxID=175788 RepID=A0AAE0PQY4_9TELE|nr:hypothetical protein QTP70_003066 [Hemibagrus guttatus]